MKPLTERDTPSPYAPNQIDVTDETRPDANVVDFVRASVRRHQERTARLVAERQAQRALYRRRDDGPEAA